jgi:hypothetical protein
MTYQHQLPLQRQEFDFVTQIIKSGIPDAEYVDAL